MSNEKQPLSCIPLLHFAIGPRKLASAQTEAILASNVSSMAQMAFAVPWMSWCLIHFLHVFECDAVVRPLCPLANLFVGVFVWALAPFVCLVCCFFWRNASLAGGFAGRLAVSCDVGLLWFACSFGPFRSLYKWLFYCLCSCKDRATARHRPYSRKKNKWHSQKLHLGKLQQNRRSGTFSTTESLSTLGLLLRQSSSFSSATRSWWQTLSQRFIAMMRAQVIFPCQVQSVTEGWQIKRNGCRLRFKGDEEVAHSSYDVAFTMLEKDTICENMTSVRRCPTSVVRWIHLVFSALEEGNLFFHLDGEIIRDGWHRICTFHVLHVLLEMTKPNNNILVVFFEYFDCTENTVRIWICIVTWKIKPFSICFALVVVDEVHEGIVRRS